MFAAKDVYDKGWSGLSTPEAVQQAAELLEDLNWLSSQRIETGGRPMLRYAINPKVFA